MKTSRSRQRLSAITLACGLLMGLGVVVAPASSATPAGFTAWPRVSYEACAYWKNQYAQKGYLTTACHSFAGNTWSFDYKRQLN
ncbi:hypothetical protein SAMN04489740_2505 [Arthrobacter alpinus]|uniref:Uncharacterized protein n=1 Tax=Arthrobacter alpinus TaxID=656366 RepID=A0A1H5LL31_9MICC|nr:hypothetical protein [Arthrobacter alpinus]SEE77755.1 hypothetical protein SAMN04489740_2505 [Arthrobacter alpinus]